MGEEDRVPTPARAGFWKDDQGDRWGSPAPDKGHDSTVDILCRKKKKENRQPRRGIGDVGVHRAPRCEPVVSLVRSRRAPPVPLIVLPKSCARAGVDPVLLPHTCLPPPCLCFCSLWLACVPRSCRVLCPPSSFYKQSELSRRAKARQQKCRKKQRM